MFLKLFALWAPLAAIIAYWFPSKFSGLGGLIVPLLTLVMLCMGLTLKPSDFLNVVKYKSAMVAGMTLQFLVMPFTALFLSNLFGLGQDLTLGMVLVGTVAGGVSSNVMTYLARGHVALSVSMTALSTLLSIVMTPLMLTLLVGSKVDIPAAEMLASLFKIILMPITLGVVLNTYVNRRNFDIEKPLSIISVSAILLIIAIVVGLNADQLASVGLIVVLATLLHNVTGMTLGYLSSSFLGFDKRVCRTIAIEVGMQNSGLATALAIKFFTPISALPGAIFSVWLNITGSIFAAVSRHFDDQTIASDAQLSMESIKEK